MAISTDYKGCDIQWIHVSRSSASSLSDFADYVIGRMGVPYKERSVRLISVAVDAPQDKTAALSGKIGSLPGVSVKTAYASI